MLDIDMIQEKCCGCEACEQICPKNSIVMKDSGEGFLYPYIDRDTCINCDLCVNVCPIFHEKRNKDSSISAYAVWSLDNNLRRKSGSGGFFTTLAKDILNNNGVVIGASYDNDFEVKHIYTTKLEDLKNIQGTKYVQSSINKMYKKAKEQLDVGKVVLFSGTPCQIEGLNKYLKKDYENLITCGLICHGVPSPGVFKKYIKYLEEKYNSKIKNIDFRKKSTIPKEPGFFEITFINGEKYLTIGNGGQIGDLYYRGFLSNLYLRKSCYECSYKLNSDFIIGDFWGIENFNSKLSPHDGINVVLCINEKSLKIINKLTDKLYMEKVSFDPIIKYNPNIIKSSYQNEERENFFNDYKKGKKINVIFNKFLEQDRRKLLFSSLVYRIIRKIKRKVWRIGDEE